MGSRASSAKQVTFMNFPPAILGGPVGFLGGNGGGDPSSSAGRPNPSSISSNRVNLSSSSHSGCWPPRLSTLVLCFPSLRVMTQYGSCFPMFLLLGRFFCELWVSYWEQHLRGWPAGVTYSLEYDDDEGANFAACRFHRNGGV